MGFVDIRYGFITWSQNTEPTGAEVQPYKVWFDTLINRWKIRNTDNDGWWTMCAYGSQELGPSGDIGIFAGGQTAVATINTITYITISTTGNANAFGNLTVARYALDACSNGSNGRGVFGGGDANQNTMDYINISASPGGVSAIDFGDLSFGRGYPAATSNSTNGTGLFASGFDGSSRYNTMDYITISSPGNSNASLGDLAIARSFSSAISNGINDRAVIGCGTKSGSNLVIDYINMITKGETSVFGNLSVERSWASAVSNGTNERGVFAGGQTVNVMDYITISSTGNATDFGDLTVARYVLAGLDNPSIDRGVFGGGRGATSYFDVMDYITISSTGNATDFGDLAIGTRGLAATSNS